MRVTRLVVCASAAVLFLAGAPAPAAGVKPRLSLVSAQPLVVRGAHFAGRERVRLSFRAAAEPFVRVVRTTARGMLVAPAPAGLVYSPCASPLVVVATGARGDRAVLKVPQRECPSARSL